MSVDRELRLEAFVRAALLHRAGRRDLLLFSMREAFDQAALDFLGYTSIDALIAAYESRRVKPVGDKP